MAAVSPAWLEIIEEKFHIYSSLFKHGGNEKHKKTFVPLTLLPRGTGWPSTRWRRRSWWPEQINCHYPAFVFPPIYIYIYIKERCLSVCLFVCSDLEHKLLDGSQPNLAWATLWYMWVTSKYLFWGVDPPREGQNFWKTKKITLSPYGPGRSIQSVCGTFYALKKVKKLFNGSTGWFHRAAKRPAPSKYRVTGNECDFKNIFNFYSLDFFG